MNSCIYEGRVLHRRFKPVPHAFTYKLFMLYLDLSDLDTVFKKRWLWSTRYPNVAWFRRKEHLGDPNIPLDQAVRDFVYQKTGRSHEGPIRLLTHLRYFGLQMNPVSFFFCIDDQQQLKHIVAEVNNTPWGQQHCYLLDPQHFSSDHSTSRKPMEKNFHVSPFMPMNMTYRWRITPPTERLNMGISNFRNNDSTEQGPCDQHQGERTLNVAMTMARKPLTKRAMCRVLLRYPLMTSQVFIAIYWQAFRLWRKKIPFVAHPDKQPARQLSDPSLPSPSITATTSSENSAETQVQNV